MYPVNRCKIDRKCVHHRNRNLVYISERGYCSSCHFNRKVRGFEFRVSNGFFICRNCLVTPNENYQPERHPLLRINKTYECNFCYVYSRDRYQYSLRVRLYISLYARYVWILCSNYWDLLRIKSVPNSKNRKTSQL